MSDISTDVTKIKSVVCGDLVIGNHDSITLYGAQEQSRLNDYSKTISKILLARNFDVDNAIINTISEIENMEKKKNETHIFDFGNKKKHKEMTKIYRNILEYIDEMIVNFKYLEIQLIKENKILERLAVAIKETEKELEKYIDNGYEFLNDYTSNIPVSLDSFLNEDSMDGWYYRLRKKISDIEVSHTLAVQNRAQIKILYNNNLAMLDKITMAIYNTFPLWKTQIAISLGIELYEKRNELQNKVLNDMQQVSKEKNDSKASQNTFDDLNEKLRAMLKEIDDLENKDNEIRNKIKTLMH